VEFKIHGKSQLFGDGFAMWITKDRGEQGPVFGGKDNFEGLGIFFDTYKNNRPGVVFPMVMAMVGDGKTPYDKDNDGKASELTGCSARGIRQANVPTKVRVTYFQDKFLKVELQYKSDNEWTECFNVENPPTLPTVTYLGFTAETGELSDNHDIISINAKNLYTTTPPGGRTPGGFKKPPRPVPSRKKKGSWTWFFTKIILVVLAIGGGYVGYTVWRTSQKKAHRF
jgi:lectin, mannose-binding 2